MVFFVNLLVFEERVVVYCMSCSINGCFKWSVFGVTYVFVLFSDYLLGMVEICKFLFIVGNVFWKMWLECVFEIIVIDGDSWKDKRIFDK